jgi:hypothetical protein
LVDHINCNRFDCRRANMRLVTTLQNCVNRPGNLHSSSRFKGVRWMPSRSKWKVEIRKKHIGYFTDEVAAAVAYDVEAFKLWGDHAWLNFPR